MWSMAKRGYYFQLKEAKPTEQLITAFEKMMKESGLLFLSFVVRWLIFVTKADEPFKLRIEIVTPLTSWSRLKECIALAQYGILPYSGDTCHQPPLVIALFQLLDKIWSSCLPFVFMLCDIVGGYLLIHAARLFVEKQIARQASEKIRNDVEILLWKEEDIKHIPYLVGSIYLLNPFTIATCAASSTTSVLNFLICLTLYFLIQGHCCYAAILVSFSSYLSFYPIMLLVPIFLHHAERNGKISWLKIISVFFVFLTSSACLLLGSYMIYESWDFIDAVYMFILKVPDLTPNMGLFWYFFLEMFEHFRLFFLCVLQLHIFFYLIPFTVLFWKRPVFLFYVLLATISWCKSYASIGDLIIPLALLPLWSNIRLYFRSLFVTVLMLFFSTILAPVLYHLWVYAGSGNANFFYATTLAFNLGQILLLSDVIYAYLKRDFHLKHGLNPSTEDGEDGIVVMK